ncbi:GH116 family glycosyl-hydrolase [Pontiellaceae bacterium B12219]|nr:GH116 family glycosyl-hydrolase [Pontiellaceae bacterium B12219]
MKYIKTGIMVLTAVITGMSSVQAQEGKIRFDFETGDLQGWKIYSGAFGEKLVSDKPEFWNSSKPYNKQGTYHLSTLEGDGSRAIDSLTGVILSPVFELQGSKISFLIGGGKHANTYVALCSEDGQVLKAAGQNNQTMQSVVWNAPELVGKKAFLVVVDENKGGWGHITLDDFQAEGRILPEEDQVGMYKAYQQNVKEKHAVSLANLQADRKTLRAERLTELPKQNFFLKGHPALRSYWRFDGDVSDTLGGFHAEGSADVEFVPGAVEGLALRLTPGQHVAVPGLETIAHGPETLELFFKLNALPEESYNPVIVSWASEELARFDIGVKHDLSGLIYNQGWHSHHITHIELPTGKPVELGRWYHLTIMSEKYDLRMYINGYECALTGGALHISRREKETAVPMTFGVLAKKEARAAEIDIDEVAHYSAGLSLEEIRDQLKAGGWGTQIEQYGREVEQYHARLRQVREEKRQAMLNDPVLTAQGETKVYRNEALEAISFTVGGIGAGAIEYNGSAEPAIWRLGCNFENTKIADSFLAVRVQSKGGQAMVRALQTKPVGSFPAMPSLRFTGEYPFATYRFEEPDLPVEMELEVFNPFTPMDAKSSAIPCIITTVKATNTSSDPVRVDVLAAQKNIVGYTSGARGSRPAYGQNQNRMLLEGDTTLLHMTKGGDGQGSDMDMVLMTQAANASGLASWASQKTLYDAFFSKGELAGAKISEPSSAKQTVNGALSAPLELAPGESKSITYVLTWYMPKEVHGQSESWTHPGNMYENWWSDAMDVAGYLRKNMDDLTARTRRFHQALYDSNLPVWLLDRLSSQLAILRAQTCWWAADGYFGCYEGAGSCNGNCTHVWHYAQAHARLFPELGRKMREQDFARMAPDGRILMRHSHPNSQATDGHFGTLLNAYREHLCSTDDTWLKEQWPQIETAFEWAIEQWDPDQDGYMQNRQDNTLDGHLYGCTSWMGSMYLTSLEAVARMAEVNGNPQLAASCRKIRESGRKLQNERLWNGEYYIQKPGEKRNDDYFNGCHIDQLLGEWWAEQVGIDKNYSHGRSKIAMKSLFKYNFQSDFQGQSLRPRQFAAVEDAGLKMITWPNDPRPIPCMDYGDEVMTGFEYAAAATMIQHGLLSEGLTVIKAVSDRYDGCLRTDRISPLGVGGYTGNPFGDDECGKFYGRALSIWSSLLILQGFDYDGPAGRIGFAPRWQPEDHASFFTAAEGYGLFTQVKDANKIDASIDLREGQLRLTEVVLAATNGKSPSSVEVKLDGKPVKSRFKVKDGDVRILFTSPRVLQAGQQLDIRVFVN